MDDFGLPSGGADPPYDDNSIAGKRPKVLPADLPTSLDDRRIVREPVPETEMYDGWQGSPWHTPVPHTARLLLTRRRCSRSPGQSQFLTSPIVAKPLKFSELSLDDKNYDEELTRGIADSDTRLMEMLAAQAAHNSGAGLDDGDAIATNEKLSDQEKRDMLQKVLNMAASNGNVEQVNKILMGKAKDYVDVNAQDEDGTPPLIYASCFVRHVKSDHTATRGVWDLLD